MKFAIVSMDCKFPGNIDSPEDFFLSLIKELDSVNCNNNDKWSAKYFCGERYDKIISSKGGFINNSKSFDNNFFNISNEESKNMDPQQKNVLEISYNIFKKSNSKYKDTNTGVFVGSSSIDSALLNLSLDSNINQYSITSNVNSIIANRVSYFFNLKGPSLTIDTACSSFAYALYIASISIKNGDCDQALVIGSNYLENPKVSVGFSRLNVLSKEGKCKSFDEKANGYVRSEGFGGILIKPLEDAVKNNDTIYAIINNIKCNQDGKTVSLTRPSKEQQLKLLKDSYKNINLKDLIYFETHGTGTKIGDPIELNAINEFLEDSNIDQKLKIGSVKTNLGHLESASSVASVIKCCMMFYYKKLLPSIHFKAPNSNICWDNLTVQTKVEEIKLGKYVGINSFGFGGSNCHIILENYENTSESDNSNNLYYPIIVGSKSKKTLDDNKLKWVEYISKYKYNLSSLSYNLILNCKNMKYFKYAIVNDINEINFKDEELKYKDKLVFVLSGQGQQYPNMGKKLYERFTDFKNMINKCDAIYNQYSGISLIHDLNLFKKGNNNSREVYDIEFTLPSIIFFQIGLYKLLESLDIKPEIIVGHSFGEISMLYIGGYLTLEDILYVTYVRAKLLKKYDNLGEMIAVSGTTLEYVENILQKYDNIWVACQNSIDSYAIAGKSKSITEIILEFQKNNIFCKKVRVTNAFHTPLMDIFKDEFMKEISQIKFLKGNKNMITYSTVYGKEYYEFNKEYLWDNISKPVLFSSVINKINNLEDSLILEISSHPVLKNYLSNYMVLEANNCKKDNDYTFIDCLSKIIMNGNNINFDKFVERGPLYIQPNYIFDKDTKSKNINKRLHPKYSYPFIDNIFDISKEEKVFETNINLKKFPFLKGHQLNKSTIFPATGFIEIALEVAKIWWSDLDKFKLNDLNFIKPLIILQDVNIYTKSTLQNNRLTINFYSNEILHCSLYITRCNIIKKLKEAIFIDKFEINKEDFYKKLSLNGLKYSNGFDNLEKIKYNNFKSQTKIKHYGDEFLVDPCLLDSIIHSVFASIDFQVSLPIHIESLKINLTTDSEFNISSQLVDIDSTNKFFTVNYNIYNSDDLIGTIKNLKVKSYDNKFNNNLILCENKWLSSKFGSLNCNLFTINQSKYNNILNILNKDNEILNKILALLVSKNINEISKYDKSTHMEKYFNVLKKYKEYIDISDNYKIDNMKYELQLIEYIGNNLINFFKNNNFFIKNIFKTDILDLIYNNSIFFYDNHLLIDFIDNLNLKDFQLNILEIGGGTGGLTSKILKSLLNKNYCYTFSDKYNYFFNKIEEKYGDRINRLLQVDINNNIKGEYNLIIGSDVIHTSSNIKNSIKNIFNSLNPNGLLCFIDFINSPWWIDCCFGIFKEWLQHDRYCYLNEKEWVKVLKEVGFINIKIYSYSKFHALIVAQKPEYIKKPSTNYHIWNGKTHLELLDFIKDTNHDDLIINPNSSYLEKNLIKTLVKTIKIEYPNLNIKFVDGIISDLDKINLKEDFIKIKDNKQYFERLVRFDAKNFNNQDFKYCLGNNLTFKKIINFNNLRSKEVLIEPIVSTLNFRDLAIHYKLIKLDKELGLECFGKILKVGEEVTKFKIGDFVYGITETSSLSNYAISHQDLLIKSNDECEVTKPIVIATAYYSLIHKANIKKSDKVLIHSACGGVGLAAIEICKKIGCTIIATVGTDKKKKYLKDKYGLKFISNSRDNKIWKKDIKKWFGSIDVILNSLSGDAIDIGLELLDNFGRFIEIGKKDYLENKGIPSKYLLKNISLFSVHIDNILKIKPFNRDFIDALRQSKNYNIPIDKTFDLKNISDAFEYMKKGEHIGKIIIKNTNKIDKKLISDEYVNLFSREKTYIISGGVSKIGIALANWLSLNGAGFIVLLTRRKEIKESEEIKISNINSNVFISNTDVTNIDQVNSCLPSNYPKVDGVFHLANELDDKLIKNLKKDNYNKVWKPKVVGCNNLYNIFGKCCRYFVLFSSFVSISGNRGQSVYSVANSWLDTFSTLYENVKVINICAIGDIGIFSENPNLRNSFLENGNLLSSSTELLDSLKKLLTSNNNQIIMTNFDWKLYNNKNSKIFNIIHKEEKKEDLKDNSNETKLLEYLKNLLFIDKININYNLIEYGIDSLLSAQLSSWIKNNYNLNVNQDILLKGIKIKDLIEKCNIKFQ